MIDREHPLPIKRQAEVLSISRGTAYYKPRPVSEQDLLWMRQLDELHLNYPFAGSRMLRDLLRQQGSAVGRRHVGTLMKRMGIEAIYRRPNTSKPASGHTIYPYLLRNLTVTRPNQVWAMDISYIPMARGFVYLAAVVDWFSRKILSWKLSITMDVSFCLEAVEEALSSNERPEIFNTDQGSQFSSVAFTEQLKKNEIQISMDGKGCWRDNVFVERIWRTIDSVQEAKTCLGKYIDFYNKTRPHSSLKGRHPIRSTSTRCRYQGQPNQNSIST
jgi:putative transposase